MAKKRTYILRVDFHHLRQKKGDLGGQIESHDRFIAYVTRLFKSVPGLVVDSITHYRADPDQMPTVDPRVIVEEGYVYCHDHGCIHDNTTNPYDEGAPSCRKAEHRPVAWIAKDGDCEYDERLDKTRVANHST